MQDLLASRPLYPRFMGEFLRTLPSGVWLMGLTTTNEGNGLGVSLQAKALLSEDVSKWLRTLGTSTVFREPVLGPLSGGGDADKTYSFTMTLKYAPPAEAAP